jgi:predicted dehydrogenase
MASRIGVGIIGAGAERGWARAAHIPALQALADDFEIRAVSTARMETARRSAEALGAKLAFDNANDLAARPEIDLVVVAVNVTRHLEAVLAAIAAGKMVYCEWPLGRNLVETEELARLAREKAVRTVIGLQGRFAPAVRWLRDLARNGWLGKILGVSVRGTGPDDVWAGVLDEPYEFHADVANGATMLTIPTGHALDMLAFALGEFIELDAKVLARRGEAMRLRDGARLPLTAPDEVAIHGVLANGALASVRYHGGRIAGPDFIWEVHGTDGNLALMAENGYANIAPLHVHGARGRAPIELMQPPADYALPFHHLTPAATNVAALYAQFARDLRNGSVLAPDFETALLRHRLIDAIERSSATGSRQSLEAARAG